MPDATKTESIRCLIDYRDFRNLFKPHGEYSFSTFPNGTVENYFNVNIFIGRFAEYLLRPENRYRQISASTSTQDAFTEQEFAKLESLIDEHNTRVQGLVAQMQQSAQPEVTTQ